MKAAPPKDLTPPAEPVSRAAFQAEVAAWAEKLRVRPKAVHVRRMKRKWGSCSTTGRVTFNADLLRQHPEFRQRVIVEELLHLRIPNHGKLFQTLLKAYLGGASLRES
jgi:predicted metal-dependent hydrolase